MSLCAVVEGDTDVPVVEALARSAGLEVASILDMEGKGQLDKRLKNFVRAGRLSPWLVLRDLDTDADCAPTLLAEADLGSAEWLALRLAVREVEAWLMADATALARFLSVDVSLVPRDPDGLDDPKLTLVNLARKSHRAEIRKAMVPAEGMKAVVGPLYEAKIIEFARNHWSLERACAKSDSLCRARSALDDLGRRWKAFAEGDG